MLSVRILVLLLAAGVAAGCAPTRATTDTLPTGAVVGKDIKIPSNVTVAAYLPSNYRKSRVFLENLGFWIQPGKSLEDGVSAVLQHYFTASFLAEPESDRPYGLLIAIHPHWKLDSGTVRMTMSYQVYGAQSAVLLEGKQTFVTPLGNASSSNGFYNAALRTSQLLVADVLTRLHPDESKFPTGTRLKDVSPELIVDREEPIATGTGFFINAAGQVMTAAHVLHDCVTMEVKRDDKIYHSRPVASSILLDLAVIDTGVPVTRFLPLRKDAELNLGEPVANVGFPLQSILAASPNLTRGNVSSRGALAGSVGQFQFSAPIQPGSSGGPVVSDGGELLGITVSTLNAAPLIASGALPQNVNFALDARYAAMFLRQHKIAFTEVAPNPKGDIHIGNDAALSTVVQLSCYQ